MDIGKVISELRQEREQLDLAIINLERLHGTSGRRRRGRPPAWMTALKSDAVPKRRGRPPGSRNKPKP